MFRVIFHEGSEDNILHAWFGLECQAKEYAEALKGDADSYSIVFVPKHKVLSNGWVLVWE
jgi:hypothetical protein